MESGRKLSSLVAPNASCLYGRVLFISLGTWEHHFMKEAKAQQLLETTRDAYDRAAEEFSASRARFWKELEYLLSYAEPGMKAIDIGCGNGRLYPMLAERDVDYTGVDNSEGLLKEARALHPAANIVKSD